MEKDYIDFSKQRTIEDKLKKELNFNSGFSTFDIINIRKSFGILEFYISFINYTDVDDNPYQRYNAFVFYGTDLMDFENNRSFVFSEEEKSEFLNKFISKYKIKLHDITNCLNK